MPTVSIGSLVRPAGNQSWLSPLCAELTFLLRQDTILMAWCKAIISPLLMPRWHNLLTSYHPYTDTWCPYVVALINHQCFKHTPYSTIDFSVIMSLWPSDAIWWHKSGTTLPQLTASCLMAPSLTWTDVDFSSMVFYGTQIRPISWPVLNIPILEMSIRYALVR